MPTWSLSTGIFQIEIDAPAALDPMLRPVVDLVKALAVLNGVVPVDFFKVEQDALDLTRYAYKIDLADGRKWRQNLFFQPGVVHMTFNVSDPWALPEFEPHRAIRDLTVKLVVEHGATRIHANWS